MIPRLVILVIFFLCIRAEAAATDVFVLKSYDVKPFNHAIKGFRNACGCNMKELSVSELDKQDVLLEIRKEKPQLILAVGAEALSMVSGIEDLPVIYMMVQNPYVSLAGNANIKGVSMYIAPERQLSELLRVLPRVKRIGLIYDPVKSSVFVKKAIIAAKAKGLTLILKETNRSNAVPVLLSRMRDMDVFWMLPDSTVLTPETVEFILLFSLESSIPIFTFSEKYTEMGALLSLSVDVFDLGRKAGEMARAVLNGKDIRALPEAVPEKDRLFLNSKAAKMLGISLNPVVPVEPKAAGKE